jgi:hypothetical protein
MNFMNRRMFQAGGSVTYADGKTQTFDVNTFQQKINTLPDNDLFALKNSADAGQIVFSPELKSILDQATQRKAMPFTQNLPGMKPGSMSSILQDYGRVATGVLGPAVSGLTRQIFSEEQLENRPILKSVAEYDSPFYGEGAEGFRLAADRAGRTTEELEGIIRKSGDIQDFTKDIEAIEQPVVEAVETKDVLDQPTVIEELPTLGPVTGGETLGVMSPLESTQRRLAFEKAMIGKDEFGNPLPEGRLLQDPTIAKALEELTPIESLVDINKTEADSLLETQDKFDGKFGIPKIELDKVDTTVVEDRDTAKAPVVPKETTGLFGSDRFLDFIRNVGGELARTGQMGEGLALGAAKAGEERAARDLMEEQEKKKYERDLALAIAVEKAKSAGDNIPDIMKPDKILELNNNVKRDITDFQGGLAGVGFVDYAIEIIEDAEATGKPVGGFGGFIASLVDKGYAFAGMGKDFDSLSADSKVAELTKVVKQKNLQAILGESGRTISDKDREIIERVFGDLSVFESVSSVLGKLKESRRGLAANNAERYSNIQTNSDFLLAQGPYGKRFYTDMLPSLKSILGIDPYASQSASARATFGGQPIGAGSQSITDINLRKPGT